MITQVLAQFCGERDRYVVPCRDVADFKPKGVTDFDENETYKIKWPVQRRENGDPTEVYYDAKILLLAADPQSMIKRAAMLKIKLPPAYVKSVGNEAQPKQSKTTKATLAVARKVSKHARKQVATALENSRKERMKEMVELHKTDVHSTTGNTDRKGTVFEKPEVPEAKNISVPVAMDPIPKVDITDNEADHDTTDGRTADLVFIKPSNSAIGSTLRTRSRKRKADDDDNTSEGSDVSYISSTSEMKRLQDTIVKLQSELSHERKRRRIAETEKISAKLSLEKWESAFAVFSGSRPVEPSPAKYSTVDCWVESTLQYSEGKSNTSQPVKSLHFGSADKVKKELFPSDILPMSPPQYLNQKKPLSANKSPVHKSSPSPKKLTPKKVHGSASKSSPSPKKLTPKKVHGSASKSSPSPKKLTPKEVHGSASKISPSPKKVSPKKSSPTPKTSKKKKKAETLLAPGQLSHKDLAPTLLSALKNEKKLEMSADNLKVHLGNGVYIKKSIWETRVMKESVKLSIMVLDLAEEVWGFERCAKLSLQGGVSPKTPSAAPKDIAPREVVEVIMGVYRAKLLFQGMSNNEEHLANALKGCLDSLRNKFKDSARKVKDLKKKEVKKGEQ